MSPQQLQNFYKVLGSRDRDLARADAIHAGIEAPIEPAKKRGGQGGFLTNLLPIIGGTVGAAGGTLLAPGVGTLAGGAAGSGLGEFLRQSLSGEDTDFGTIARESAFGAIPGGLGLAAKGARALKAGRAASSTVDDVAGIVPTQPAPQIGREAVGSTLRGQQAILAGQADEATRFNELARQNIQRLAQERSGQGVPLPGGGLLSRPGQTPSFITEGVELKTVPKVPELPSRYSPSSPMPSPAQSITPKATTPEAAMQQMKPTITQRVKGNAQQASSEGFGVTVGQNMGRGKILTPDGADDLSRFINERSRVYGGIRPGKPINQAKDAQSVFNNVKKELDTQLEKINRSLTPDEVASIAASATQRVGTNAAVTGTTKTLEKLSQNLANAKDLKSLEAVRREADDIAFTASGAGKTSAAAQAKALRDSIDEFITPLSPAYKTVKGDYMLAKEALDATSKASKNAKGYTIPLVNVEVGKQAIPGAKNAMAAKVGGVEAVEGAAAPGGFRPFAKSLVKPAFQQTATRAGATGLFGTPFVGSGTPEGEVPPELSQADTELAAGGAMDTGPSQREQLFAGAMEALAAGDTKTYKTLADAAELAAKFEKSGADKPLSAEATKVVANAESGLTSLSQLRDLLAQDPSLQGKSAISGTFDPFGATSAALGTSSYETAARNIADVITRLRTGAALTASEEAFYKRQLPQPFDPPETVQQKLAIFDDLFNRVASQGSMSNELDPSQLLAGAL